MVNPFSTKFWVSGAIPFQFLESGESIDSLLDKAHRHSVCQIVGPHGSGKSTLLLELRKRYETRYETSGVKVQYLFFNDQHQRIPGDITFREEQIFFVDGFEQLPLFRRFWLRCRAKRLIVTSHRPVWCIPILYRTKPQFAVFTQIVRQMVLNPPEETLLRDIFERSGGNFRSAFFELYDMFTEPAA